MHPFVFILVETSVIFHGFLIYHDAPQNPLQGEGDELEVELLVTALTLFSEQRGGRFFSKKQGSSKGRW